MRRATKSLGCRLGVVPVVGRSAECDPQAMSATGEPRRLGLEIRFDAEPIQGRLYDHDDRLNRPFSGWLGLMAAIEAARGADLAPAPGAAGRNAMRARNRHEVGLG